MIMSSIVKRPLRPFDLLGFAIFVSAFASALLILSWKVLITLVIFPGYYSRVPGKN
jgi:hypothetical protein